MATASDNIQKLIEQARADSQGPRRVQSTDVFNNNGTLYGAIDPTFATNIGLSGGERIEKYVSEDGRAMVMLFPEDDDDESV